MSKSMDMEEQYDRIYRYCYFRLSDRQTAEDITQETFLRYLERYQDTAKNQALKYLYTIAKNLCIDEYRRCAHDTLRKKNSMLAEAQKALEPDNLCQAALNQENSEEKVLTGLAVRTAVAALEQDEQEILLLRYVNEVPITAIAQLLGISRFAVYRKLTAVSKKFRDALKKEGF